MLTPAGAAAIHAPSAPWLLDFFWPPHCVTLLFLVQFSLGMDAGGSLVQLAVDGRRMTWQI
jgi:hypothetical protein